MRRRFGAGRGGSGEHMRPAEAAAYGTSGGRFLGEPCWRRRPAFADFPAASDPGKTPPRGTRRRVPRCGTLAGTGRRRKFVVAGRDDQHGSPRNRPPLVPYAAASAGRARSPDSRAPPSTRGGGIWRRRGSFPTRRGSLWASPHLISTRIGHRSTPRGHRSQPRGPCSRITRPPPRRRKGQGRSVGGRAVNPTTREAPLLSGCRAGEVWRCAR